MMKFEILMVYPSTHCIVVVRSNGHAIAQNHNVVRLTKFCSTTQIRIAALLARCSSNDKQII